METDRCFEQTEIVELNPNSTEPTKIHGSLPFAKPLTPETLENIRWDVGERRTAVERLRRELPYAGAQQLGRIMR